MAEQELPEALQRAEKAARDGSLKISSNSTYRGDSLPELISPHESLDEHSLKVYRERKMRKFLLCHFPRLGQVLEDIAKIGSIEEYIKRRFGEVYLYRGYVRFFDLNLSQSRANEVQQWVFLGIWYIPIVSEFDFSDLVKISDKIDLPRPGALKDLVDQELLAKAVKKRSKRNNFLDKAVGRYAVKANVDLTEFKRRIAALLEVTNSQLSADLIIADPRKIIKTLIHLGIHPRNPMLANFGCLENPSVTLVVSNEPLDILQASTEKPWYSCVNLAEGEYQRGLYEDIANSAVIAYVMQGDKFVSRMIIRAGFTLRRKKPAAAIEKLYGDQRYRILMQKALRQILKQARVAIDTPMETHSYSNATCLDSYSSTAPSGGKYYYMEKEHKSAPDGLLNLFRRFWRFLNQDIQQCFTD